MAHGLRKVHGGDPVLAKIDAIRRSVRAWTLGWGYLWTALIVAGMIFAGVLLDHIFALPRGGRLAFFRAFLLALGSAAAVATLFPFVKRMGRLYIARRMEARRPELKNALISYLQCREDPATPAEIKRLLRHKAVRSIRSLGTGVVVDPSRFVRLSVALCAVVVAFLVYGVVSPKSAVVSVRRLLRPRADIVAPTGTHVTSVEPGELYAVAGDEPRIKVVTEGLRPATAYVVWDGASFRDRRILLTRKEESRWEGSFPPIIENGSYYVVAGDASRERYGITVLPAPAVTQLQLTLTPPAYTGMPVRTVTDGNLDVPAGTTVGVRAVTNLPPQTGCVEFDSGRRVWLELVRDDHALSGEFAAIRSDAYVVRFESVRYPNGATFSNSMPVKFRLTCREDQPPAVKLLGPEDGLKALPTEKVAVTYNARDDFRLARVRLRYTVNDLVGQALVVAEPRGARVENGAYDWDLSATSAVPGSVLAYYLEAQDTRPGLPQVGRSESRRIYVIGPRGQSPSEPGGQGTRAPSPDPPEQPKPGAKPAEPPVTKGTQPPAKPEDVTQLPAGPSSGQTLPPEPAAQPDGARPPEERRALEDYARKVADLLDKREHPPEGRPPEQQAAPPAEGERRERLLPSGQSEDEGAARPAEAGRPGPEAVADAGTEARAARPDGQTPSDQGAAQAEESETGRRQTARTEAPAQVTGTRDQREGEGERTRAEPDEAPEIGKAESAEAGPAEGAAEAMPGNEARPGRPTDAGKQPEGVEGTAASPPGTPGGLAVAGEQPATERHDPGATAPGAEPQSRPESGRGAADNGRGASDSTSAGGEGTGLEGTPQAAEPPSDAKRADAQDGRSAAGAPQGSAPAGPSQGAAEEAESAAGRQGAGQETGGAAGAASDEQGDGGAGARGRGLPPESDQPAARGRASGTGVRSLPQSGRREGALSPRSPDSAVDELARMLADDRLPPDLLRDLGTNRQTLQQFVDRYKRERDAVAPSPGLPPQAARPEGPEEAGRGSAEGRVVEAARAAEGVAAKDALPTTSDKDTLRNRFEGADERLSPRYREVVERYYKVLSEER